MELKRHRRTKKEMQAFRALLIPGAGKDIPDKVKTSQKLNLEAQTPILDATKVGFISGWVNVYKHDTGDYWLGSDIHYTIEGAKKIGCHHKWYNKTIYVNFEGD